MKTLRATVALQLLTLFLVTLPNASALACRFTPLEWQQVTIKHGDPRDGEQRKHTSWSRDRNRDFIDDQIYRRFQRHERVNVIVDLNRCIPARRIAEVFSKYGRIAYVGRLITYVMLDGVRVSDLPTLAGMEEVAMVEWQVPGRAMNDVSTRAVQARKSPRYSTSTAEDDGITGNDVVIAIVDTGVDDSGTLAAPLDGHKAFPRGKFVAGFDATEYEDVDIINGFGFDGIDDSCQLGTGVCVASDGTTNPADASGHGTHVAGTALGAGIAGGECGAATNDPAPCSGVARGARLVDVQACDDSGDCDVDDVAEALDWIAIKGPVFGIRVANLSLAFCDTNKGTSAPDPDDGTSALAQQVSYVVARGIAVAAAHGNASECGISATGPTGLQHMVYPGSSALAMTVAASNDMESVAREGVQPASSADDDAYFSDRMIGPMVKFDPLDPDPLWAALKPDIAAPGYFIASADSGTANGYVEWNGTSMATPHVAGAAAVVIEKRSSIGPGDLKALLTSKADPDFNTSAFPGASNPKVIPWDSSFGWGLLNVHDALAASVSDVRFPSCTGPGWAAGQPCSLTPPMPSWSNVADIETATVPQVHMPNTIYATVHNAGSLPATFDVNFGVYVFAIGNNRFFHIGTKRVTLAANETAQVSQEWTPTDSNHQCVQVTIDFGLDGNFWNNVTQRNLSVAPSVYPLQIENPFMVPAQFRLKATSDRPGWQCRISETSFSIDPLRDCPRKVRVDFHAPPGAAPGEFANCAVVATAKVAGVKKPVVIGGVTARTFVPKPCRISATIVDARGKPLRGVRISVRPAPAELLPDRQRREERAADSRAGAVVEATSDEDGVITVAAPPQVPHIVEASHGELTGTAVVSLLCGIRNPTFVLTDGRLVAR